VELNNKVNKLSITNYLFNGRLSYCFILNLRLQLLFVLLEQSLVTSYILEDIACIKKYQSIFIAR